MLTRRYYKDDYETDTLVGTLTQMLLDAGSFSEGMVPILEGDFGQTPVVVTDDETLNQGYLKGLLEQRVQVTGEWQNGVLYALKADVLQDFHESSEDNVDGVTEASEESLGSLTEIGAGDEGMAVDDTDADVQEQSASPESTLLESVDNATDVSTSDSETVVEFQTVELVKPCPECTFLSHVEANYCWNCGTLLSSTSTTNEEQE